MIHSLRHLRKPVHLFRYHMLARSIFRLRASPHLYLPLFFARSSTRMVKSREPKILSLDILVEEETIPGYDPKRFYPINPGQVLHERYMILAKLGWGTTSTVWLAEDISRWFWQTRRYVAIKVATYNDQDIASHERNVNQYLQANPSHEGFRFMRGLINHFEITGPYGTHPCLVYEPLRETFKLFQRRLPDGKIPARLLKAFLQHILLGLDYLHSECGIVHTDIKQDNIMLTFEDPSVLEKFVSNLAKDSMSQKTKTANSVYLSSYDFGGFKRFRSPSKLVDFGLAQRVPSTELLRHPIQPPLFHAPEVILGAGWSYSADIWNLGVLIWNLLENRDLFQDISSKEGAYDCRKHIAEMIAMLGPPPRELLDREKKWSSVQWSRAFPNVEGKLCWTARECYGGPFFNSEGKFLYEDLIPSSFKLADSVPSLEGDDKELFLDFTSHMLQWLPEKRKTAKDLLKHPWLTV